MVKRIGKIAVCLVGSLACSFTLRADGLVLPQKASGNPYVPIVERNIFGLLPPPPPPDPNAVEAADLPKITANGIMDVFGNLKVLFKANTGKPGSKDNFYDLAEGQSEDNIEVVHIDETAKTVTFRNNGIEQKIALVDVSSSSGGGGGGGGGGMMGGFNGGQAGGNGGYNGGGGGGNGYTHPSWYSGPNGNNGNNGFNNGGTSYGGGNGGAGNNIGGFTFGSRPIVGTPPNLPQFPATPEQQAVIFEVERAATQDQVNHGSLPPFPPTVITPPDATGAYGKSLGSLPPAP